MVAIWDYVSFIMAGPKRLKVVKRLQKGPATPKQLSKELKIKSPNLSPTLKELRLKKIIKDLTPSSRKGKVYALSANGEKALKKIHELTKPGK